MVVRPFSTRNGELVQPDRLRGVCGTWDTVLSVYQLEDEMRDPGTAAILSFFIPGVGQIYNGRILRGIFWLIVTPGLWLGTGGLFGWVCHLIAAYTAYRYASKHPYGPGSRVTN